MNCLGISCFFHDSAAALVIDGEAVAAAEEERFSRIKHDHSFPTHAIDYCLTRGRLTASELDFVCFYEKPLRKLERTLATARNWPQRSTSNLRNQLTRMLHEELWPERILEQILGFLGKVVYCEHHLSHAASAFFPSRFQDAAVLTIDGVGEWATLGKWLGHNCRLEKLAEIYYPHSLGLLYSAITAFLGFRPNDDEYKVMGLAAYGAPRFLDQIRQLIHVHDDGSFRLQLDYFAFPYSAECMYTDELTELLGSPRVHGDPVTQRHMDIAASLQQVLNEIVVRIAQGLYDQTQCRNLCLAGGVALNGVTNWSIMTCTPFEQVFIQPAAGDSGGAIGAALFACHSYAEARSCATYTTLLGPEYSNDEIESMLTGAGAEFELLEEAELLARVADMIYAGQVIGWFQGRMEFGPRALGCRSILANPCDPGMKDTLNRRVKFREDFRPFAPAVLLEHVSEFFEMNCSSPYMLLIPPARPHCRELIPSVIHVDGTARVQTVDRETNPRFRKLIEAFAERSGVPVLLNTSFNIQGEPIVCTPADAYASFQRTDIDFLAIGNYLVTKDV